jgi:hypothetical protein
MKQTVFMERAFGSQCNAHHSFELASVLMRFNHIASMIVNANHSII